MRWVLLFALACGRSEYRPVETLRGPGADGYGSAVAFSAGDLIIGAPFGLPGAVYRGEERLLEGEGRDFLGSWINADPIWIGAPLRDPGGVVVGLAGEVLLRGEPGDNLGIAPTRVGGVVAAIRSSGLTIGDDRADLDGRAWSLAEVSADDGSFWVAGLARGGLALAARTLDEGGAYGRGLAACNLDGRPGDEVAVGDPLTGSVEIVAGSDLVRGDRSAPLATFELGPGAGAPIVCEQGRLYIGAPDLAQIIVLESPLRRNRRQVVQGSGRFGEAIAVQGDRIAVGDPDSGEVHIWAR